MIQTTHMLRISVMALLLALPAVAEAGPPLICQPFQTGGEAVLPWGIGPSWNNPDPRYDVSRLTGDTLRLLSRGLPVIARMENLRRATIYAARDARVAHELMTAVLARALSSAAAGSPDPDSLFDAGYLIESFKQRSLLDDDRESRSAIRDEPGADGYAMVVRAIALHGSDADMEFAASLMKAGPLADEHRRRAAAAARAGSLLAINLSR
jgi:hypothetical protein